MLYLFISVAYTFVNVLLTIILLWKSRGTQIVRFYSFCVGCLVTFGLTSYWLQLELTGSTRWVLSTLSTFLFSVI
ncbi:MAG: hypothetical protein HYZ34_12180, partial [Ignavibacteriae bacterium]|nr:hypothetical protein [Ignavibacteriota bacterium]